MWYHTRGAKIQWKKYKDWGGKNDGFLKKYAKRGFCGGGETVLSENVKYCRKRGK